MTESFAQIKECFAKATVDDIPALLRTYENDSRKNVASMVEKYRKNLQKYEEELLRIEKIREYENKFSQYEYICGIDEVGRGPLAGPVVAGAVILPKGCKILYVNDSKQLSAKKREELFEIIEREAVAVAYGIVPPQRIDEINILQATYEAMRIAINNLSVKPDILLNDAVTIPLVDIPQVPIIKGDAKSITIGAASIMAKVTRDRMMEDYDKIYPGYDFAGNKGYGCAAHIEALKRLGPTPIHRNTFIKGFISER